MSQDRTIPNHYFDKEVKDQQTILKYTGTAANLKDEIVDYETAIVLDSVLATYINDVN